MNSKTLTRKSEWLAFLEKFSSNQLKISFEENEKGRMSFLIENILDTDIDVSNNYGFLSLKFKNRYKRNKFLVHLEIKQEIEDFEKFKLISSNWASDKFPCRVYFSDTGKILSFYDNENELTEEKKYDNRIVTFKNIFLGIINLKITDAVEFLNSDKTKD